MKERYIRFNDMMIRAILRDEKTQTRRPVKPQPEYGENHAVSGLFGTFFHGWNIDHPAVTVKDIVKHCPFGQVGDRLWVQEAWKPTCRWGKPDSISYIRYRADSSRCIVQHTLGGVQTDNWRPSIQMPEWASRITLEITDVRLEKLQCMGDREARLEGVKPFGGMCATGSTHLYTFRELWNSLYAAKGFGFYTNCWVWVIRFRRVGEIIK